MHGVGVGVRVGVQTLAHPHKETRLKRAKKDVKRRSRQADRGGPKERLGQFPENHKEEVEASFKHRTLKERQTAQYPPVHPLLLNPRFQLDALDADDRVAGMISNVVATVGFPPESVIAFNPER